MKTSTGPQNAQLYVTAGECLPDGSLLELIRDPSNPERMTLLRWDGDRAEIADRIACGDKTYSPVTLSKSILNAIDIPSQQKDCGSLDEIFAKLVAVIDRYFSLAKRDLHLLAYFILSTWVMDALPTTVNLLISSSSAAQASQLFRLLRCLCRRAIRVGDLNRSTLCAMPMHLQPTLMVEGLTLNRATRTLLRLSSNRGSFVPRSGDLIDLHCAKVLSFGENEVDDSIAEGMLRVVQLPTESPLPILNTKEERRITEEFQPVLLDYRMRNYTAALNSHFDATQFTPEICALARSLGAAVVGDTELASGIVRLLAPDDEEARIRAGLRLECVIAMVLLVLVHDGNARKVSKVRVTEITESVNAALRANGEVVEYSPKEVGWRLVTLGIYTRRIQGGKGVLLDREFSRSVHNLARRLGVQMSAPGFPGCPDCYSSAKPSDVKALV